MALPRLHRIHQHSLQMRLPSRLQCKHSVSALTESRQGVSNLLGLPIPLNRHLLLALSLLQANQIQDLAKCTKGRERLNCFSSCSESSLQRLSPVRIRQQSIEDLQAGGERIEIVSAKRRNNE